MRQPQPWLRASKSAWFVEHNCKQVRLGIHPPDAPAPKKKKGVWNPPAPILETYHKRMVSDPASMIRSG
jgi:hypothetical protein